MITNTDFVMFVASKMFFLFVSVTGNHTQTRNVRKVTGKKSLPVYLEL